MHEVYVKFHVKVRVHFIILHKILFLYFILLMVFIKRMLRKIIVIIPSLAVVSRRLQDRGISGWWQLSYFTIIGIFVIIILLMLPAKEDENKWGRNPLLDM